MWPFSLCLMQLLSVKEAPWFGGSSSELQQLQRGTNHQDSAHQGCLEPSAACPLGWRAAHIVDRLETAAPGHRERQEHVCRDRNVPASRRTAAQPGDSEQGPASPALGHGWRALGSFGTGCGWRLKWGCPEAGSPRPGGLTLLWTLRTLAASGSGVRSVEILLFLYVHLSKLCPSGLASPGAVLGWALAQLTLPPLVDRT